jgi:hypothetical protein
MQLLKLIPVLVETKMITISFIMHNARIYVFMLSEI